MDPEQAKYHMKRCCDSGLWVADASQEQSKTDEKDDCQDDLDLD